jgi:hypothetical protein
LLDKLRDPVATALSDVESAVLQRFVQARPASHGDKDYLVWYEQYSGILDNLGVNPAAHFLIDLGAWEIAVPTSAGGEKSYLTWLGAVGERASTIADGSDDTLVMEAQRELASLLKVKPCSSGTMAMSKFAGFSTRIQSIAALSTLSTSAAPVACTQ